ncbi:MAG TPA: glutamine synthetase family protein [Gaiellales bacterium]
MPDLPPGVHGVTIVFVDNNGIPRSRSVPADRLAEACERGVGMTTLFPIFLSNDGLTFDHPPLSNVSGDLRLLATPEMVVPLAGQPAFAWTPGRQFYVDGSRSPYCPRGVLERMVERAASAGLEVRVGIELEWFIGHAGDELSPAHHGPVYSPHAMLAVDEFSGQLLADLAANGVPVGQFHAEYGLAQMELSIGASDPVTAADRQLLARQTIHAAARAHGLRASFSPVVSMEAVGNGWHIHTSVSREGRNLMSGGDGPSGMTAEGEGWVAGMLRELPALSAVAAPSMVSLIRRRPGYFAGAFAFWGVQNREASLRFIPGGGLVPDEAANVELKTSDASGNPYLSLAAIIAAGMAGLEERLTLPEPIQDEPGGWDDEERERRGVRRLPETADETVEAVASSRPVRDAFGEDLVDAWSVVRRADAAAVDGQAPDDIVAAYRWRY